MRFLIFGFFSLKCSFLGVVTYFPAQYLSSQCNFSVAVRMYITHDFDKALFFLETVVMIIENVTLTSSHSNCYKTNKFFHHNHAAYQYKLSLKKRDKTEKSYSKKLFQRCIFYPIADPNDGFKMQQKLLSWILLPLVIHLSGFDLFNVSRLF